MQKIIVTVTQALEKLPIKIVVLDISMFIFKRGFSFFKKPLALFDFPPGSKHLYGDTGIIELVRTAAAGRQINPRGIVKKIDVQIYILYGHSG